MVCWIKRAKRLGLKIPLDEMFERELMQELGVKNHRELESNLKFLHDETFEAVVESILRRRRQKIVEYKESIYM